MLIYRIEDRRAGYGPYHWSGECVELRSSRAHRRHCNPEHPGVYADTSPPAEYRCGFASLEQLYRWFRGDFTWLQRNGFVLAVYEVEPDAVFHGTYQVAFDPNHAQRLFHLSLRHTIPRLRTHRAQEVTCV